MTEDTIEVDRDELEAIVDERVDERLQETKQRRSRRSFLASLAGAAGVGALGVNWIQEVTATDGSAVGQIGTPQNRVNVYAHTIGDSNNPVDEFYVENQYDVADQGQTINVDQIGADTASQVTFNDPLSTESLVIGGTLYEEDDNSPFTVDDATTATYTIAGDFDEILIIPQRTNVGFDEVQINGKTGDNYKIVDNSDSRSTGETEWLLNNRTRRIRLISIALLPGNADQVGLSVSHVYSSDAATVFGSYDGDAITSLDSITVSESGGASRGLDARVYGRSMNI